jgi:thymidylate synthase
MAVAVSGSTLVEAWKAGCERILATDDYRVRTLITEVEKPTFSCPDWLQRYDPMSVGAEDRLSVTAKVLFPNAPRLNGEPRPDYYARWASVLRRGRKSRKLHSSWSSTYFERLLSLDGSDNQIERAIHALTSWQRKETAIVMHLSAPRIDRLKPIGSPCLQFVQVLWDADDTIHLVALYRNHDFLKKALGNFIGLGRLLAFLAKEADKKPGRLICHSARAYCDSAPKLRRLVGR